jgi:hypothetical protein
MRRIVRFIVGLVLMAGCCGPSSAQAPVRSLSLDERSIAAKLEEGAVSQWRTLEPMASLFANKSIPKLSATRGGKAQRSVVTEITLLGSPGTTSAADRRAMVSRYDYASGLTLRTTIDLKGGKIVDVKADANRPTPLARQEIQRAIEIASAVIPELKGADAGQVRALSVIQSAPKDPRYAHRLAVLWQDGKTNRVLVDLSAEEVAIARY